MRSYSLFLLCLALVLCLSTVSAVPHHAVRRQNNDNESSAPSSTVFRSAGPSATVSSTVNSNRASTSVENSSKPSISATDALNQVPATTQSFVPEATQTTVIDPKNPLPIRPTVTPAMGITGVILLITGLVYAVIGIKTKWIYVSGSAAYLTALAVTVLIIYLMNPPVSNGVQGAFFVAAFITGVIFGVLALVFADITEGFGCLLGGFCLSMWLLSLKDGGLISSSTGRAIFIGCMSAGGYSLSFSHYTRNYGLIGSISFSGATATMLGIDCLSRAGWKEFWLYLWALNADAFPLNTNTYPVTKNIKAELAGVVIIAAFGVVSQLRVWNLVKDHRAKSAAQELEEQQEKDREEEARGRNVEDNFQKERAQWEAAYGNKSGIPDSSVGSTVGSAKGSSSIKEREIYGVDSMEMMNLHKPGVASDGTTVTVNVLRDDDIRQVDAQGNPITYRKTTPTTINATDKILPERPETNQPTRAQRTSLRTVVSPPPAVIPLPFTVPTGHANSEDGDNNSNSAMPDSPTEYRPMSKRVSDMIANKRSSLNRGSRVFSESSETLERILNIEDDRRSSVAATLDNDHDDVSVRQLSPVESPIGTEREDPFADVEKKSGPAFIQDPVITPTADEPQVATPVLETATEMKQDNEDAVVAQDSASVRPTVRQSLTSSTDPKPDESSKKRDSRSRNDTVVSSSRHSLTSGPPSEGAHTERAESHAGTLQDTALPARLSKVALSYRTNEWAKHLEVADKPDLDDLRSASPGAMLEEHHTQETPAPVSDEIAAPLHVNKRDSRRVSSGSRYKRSSSIGLDRSFSQEQIHIEQTTLSRSPSGDRLDALSPLPSNTLLGQRDTLMRRRTSSQSFTPSTQAANLLAQADAEDLSLSQRRQLLQHHQSQSPPLISHPSTRKPPPSTSRKWALQNFDSHQPKRTSNSQSEQRREELLAGWRSEIQDVGAPVAQAYVVEQQRVALLNERRQKEVEKQAREARQMQRASQMDSVMRSGHMLGAHREAMRKMQAGAKE